jgi:nicotinamide mononucleotide transporter
MYGLMINWLSEHYIEVFGAITGIVYVFLEVRQTIWLWPLGIVTSAVYVWIFFSGKLYADMSLQAYYVVISILGWYWWARGSGRREQGAGSKEQGGEQKLETVRGGIGESSFAEASEDEEEKGRKLEGEKWKKEERSVLQVTRLRLKTGIKLLVTFILLYLVMWQILSKLTDSPVPGWDAFLTSLSIIATWMLARKIYEHWFLWIVINIVSVALYFSRGLYPTVILYMVYAAMSFAGLVAWKKTIKYLYNENRKT